ncbi:transcriptional regulator [Kitasatospora sp. NPDC002227]|uniref:transcriptional regulator n=1 Tax=Kitasatospora sp. NPDC002227 TaxID=3154773 RepID=UPI003328EAD4
MKVVTLPIALLTVGEPLRMAGQDTEHALRLAEVDTALPPILVERETLRVVDGLHRMMAALLKGRQTIEVEFFEGTSEDAFLRSVELNVSHGLPLSLADRRASAERIIRSHGYLSDRAIARVAGLGAKTVAAIRQDAAGQLPPAEQRVGRDGKVRPVDGTKGRQKAAELIAERPEASLREVARLAGVSPATVSDVRRRLSAGQSPQVDGAAPAGAGRGAPARVSALRKRPSRAARVVADPAVLLEKLVRDPSLRHKREGRQLLHLLRQNAMGSQEISGLTTVVPPDYGALVAGLARQYAEIWQGFAQELDERMVRSGGEWPAEVPIGVSA